MQCIAAYAYFVLCSGVESRRYSESDATFFDKTAGGSVGGSLVHCTTYTIHWFNSATALQLFANLSFDVKQFTATIS